MHAQSSSLPIFYLQCVDCQGMFWSKAEADNHKINNICLKISAGITSQENKSRPIQECAQDKRKKGPRYSCFRCKKIYLSENKCSNHIMRNRCLSDSKENLFQCYNCSLEFTKKCALITHIKQKTCTNQKNQKCFVDDCYIYFRKHEHLTEHIRKAHGDITFEGSGQKWEVESLKFSSPREFQQWMIYESNNYNCNYFLSVRKTVNNVCYTVYKCQFNKKNKSNTSHNRKSNPDLKCPSQIGSKTVNGQEVFVTYYKTHNHKPFNLKRNRIDYTRKTQHATETVQQFIENAKFDDVACLGEVKHDNICTNIDNKTNSPNLVDECTLIQESKLHKNKSQNATNIKYEDTMRITEETGEMYDTRNIREIITVSPRDERRVIGTDNLEVDTYISSEIENKIPKILQEGDKNYNISNGHLREEVKQMKCDISELFSNILEYVESSDNPIFLKHVKNKLYNVLEECQLDRDEA